MGFLVIAGAFVAVVGLLAYIRPGRSSMAIIGLGIGYILAQFWAGHIAATYGDNLTALFGPYVWSDITYVVLVVLPMLLALLFGQKRSSGMPRLVDAAMVALLALTIILPAVSFMVIVDSESRMVYGFIDQHRNLIITIILLFGLLSSLFIRPLKAVKPGKD